MYGPAGGPSPQINSVESSSSRKLGLLKHIFSWSSLDIMNDDFLRNKVMIIPMEFESLSNYFTSFHWPLLEEVRAQIKQSLELIGEAPCVPLKHVKEYKVPRSKKGSESEFFIRMKIFIGQEQLKNKTKKNGEQFMLIPKDLLMLSSSPIGTGFEESGCSGERSLFAFIEKLEEGGNGNFSSGPLTILVSKWHAQDVFKDLMDEKKTWYATYLLGLATSCRSWQALNPTDMKKPIFGIIGKTLKYHPDQNSSKEKNRTSNQELKHMVSRYCSSACRLNESQTNAVTTVVHDVASGLDPGVRMIQGPPGTGKTSTVVTLLSVAASSNMKCLIACPTNTAVAEVALRFLELLEKPGKLQFGEFCKSSMRSSAENSAGITTTCKILRKSNIILVGNEEKLPLQGQLKDIYLPNRVKLIQVANTSWRDVASTLLNFIVSMESRYQAHIDKDVDTVQHISLLQFARSNLEQPIKRLREHGKTLTQELPIDQAEGFLETAELAQNLLHHISKSTVSEQGFSEWFSRNELRVELVKRLQKRLEVKGGHLSSRESIEKLCMKCSSLVFCTVSSAGRQCINHGAPFDCLIIDEAAQLVEAETAIAACLPGLNHAILFGDHQQLPATVISKVAVNCGYGRSLFERMISLEHPCHLLNTQYRMHPAISLFPNSRFYNGCLRDGDNVTSPSYKLHEHLLYGSYAFIDVNDGAEQSGPDRKSKKNSIEAAVVLALIKMLSEACKRNSKCNLSVGIITPYSSQKDHLKRCLNSHSIESLTVDVNSVDGFQGQEKDIIIISTVRANEHGAIGFLKDYRRLNVAMTRARFCLWVVGCGKTLKANHGIWTDLLEDAVDRNLYREAADKKQIRQAIIKVKKDSNAHSDLLKTDSALFTNMLWKVIFSPGFKNSFLRVKLAEKKDKIIAKICSLSSGEHFSPHKMDCVPTTCKTEGLIEVDRVADLYLIWGIEIDINVKATQVLKIWDIVDHSNLSRCIKGLQGACNAYSDQYMEWCKVRRLSRDKKLTIPETWEKDPAIVWAKKGTQHQQCQKDCKNLLEISEKPKSSIPMKLDAWSLDIDSTPLTPENREDEILSVEVNDEETIVFQQAASSFALGQFAPGKTTDPMTNFTQSEPEHHFSLCGLNSTKGSDKGLIKQNLATSSPLLCPYIEHQITNNRREDDEEVARVEEVYVHATATNNTKMENKPILSQLLHNFRTHYSPMNVANTITNLLHQIFPLSINKVDSKTTLTGEKLPDLPKAAQEEHENIVHNPRAQQMIFFKDEAKTTQLVKRTEKSRMILTVNGCKGVQSQDSSLYTLFSRSMTPNLWKTPYGYLFQIYLMMLTDCSARREKTPLFSDVHVVIIRTRQHIWIDKQSCDQYKLNLDYWLHRKSIKRKSLEGSPIVSSTSTDRPEGWWIKSGLKLFTWQYYKAAILCFRRAGDHQHLQLAKAASLERNGQNQCFINKEEAIEKLKRAAKLFLTCGRAKKAAECYIKAGAIYIENFTPPKFEDAGDFFLKGQSWLRAAEAYFSDRCLEKCLDACLKGKHFQEGLSFIKQWKVKWSADKSQEKNTGNEEYINEHLRGKPSQKGVSFIEQCKVKCSADESQEKITGSEEYINEYLRTCGTHFHKQHDVATMLMFINAFPSIDTKRNFLREKDYFDELLRIEEDEHNYLQAANLAKLKGDLLYEAKLLEKMGDYDNAVKEVILLIHRDGLWGEQNRGWPLQKTQRSSELLQRAEELGALAKDSIRHEVEIETLLMFEELIGPHHVNHALLMAQTLGSIKMKLLIAWRALDALLSILKEVRNPNEQRVALNALLVKTLSIWIDWQDIIMHWKRVISGKVNLRKAVPGSTQDDEIRKHCYDFFGVTYAEDFNVCFVHDLDAYWFKSHQKGEFPFRISTKDFAKLAVKFWDEQLAEKEKAITDVCNLQTQCHVLLWPPIRKAQDMCHIQKLRGTTRFVAILDEIADQIMSKHEAPCKLEERGKLQLIYPFLGEAWKKKNATNLKTGLQFWIDPPILDPAFSVENYVMESERQLVRIFNSDQKSISPLVFVTLLENVAVMACACDMSLHGTFLPITLAFEFMCGKQQEVLYQKILSSKDLARKSLSQIIANINMMVLLLLKEPSALKDWFKHVQGNYETDLPKMALRLSTVMFILCLNSRDPELQKNMVIQLQQVFNHQSPILQHLPQSYTKQCHKACNIISQKKADYDDSMKHFKDALVKALTSIGDTLIVTKRCENQHCCKPEDCIMTLRMDNKEAITMKCAALASAAGFSASISLENCAVQAPDPMPSSVVIDHMTAPAAQKASTEKDGYNAYLNKKALPLKVSVDSSVHKLADTIASLNNASLLSAFDAAKKGLQQHTHCLEPSHKKHTEFDLEWLKAIVNQVQRTHNEMKQKFESKIKKIVGGSPLKGGPDKEQVPKGGKTSSIANPNCSSKTSKGNDKTNKKQGELSRTTSSSANEASSSNTNAKARRNKEKKKDKDLKAPC